jgi:hypothetical protein
MVEPLTLTLFLTKHRHQEQRIMLGTDLYTVEKTPLGTPLHREG